MQRTEVVELSEVKLAINPNNQVAKFLNINTNCFSYLSTHLAFHLTMQEQASLLRTSRQTHFLFTHSKAPLPLLQASKFFINHPVLIELQTKLNLCDQFIKETKKVIESKGCLDHRIRICPGRTVWSEKKHNIITFVLLIVGFGTLTGSSIALAGNHRRQSELLNDLDSTVPDGYQQSCRDLVVRVRNSNSYWCDDHLISNRTAGVAQCWQLCLELMHISEIGPLIGILFSALFLFFVMFYLLDTGCKDNDERFVSLPLSWYPDEIRNAAAEIKAMGVNLTPNVMPPYDDPEISDILDGVSFQKNFSKKQINLKKKQIANSMTFKFFKYQSKKMQEEESGLGLGGLGLEEEGVDLAEKDLEINAAAVPFDPLGPDVVRIRYD